MGASFDGARFSVVWAIAILVVAVLLVAWAMIHRLRKRSQEARELALALKASPLAVVLQEPERLHREIVHYARPAHDAPAQATIDEPSVWRTVKGRLLHPLRDRTPSEYSSLSPRNPDGTRTKPFYFNGSGKGR